MTTPVLGHWTHWLVERYLRTTRRDSFLRFLSWVAALGIGLGVAALILSLSAMTGLQDAIRQTASEGVDAARIGVANSATAAEVEARIESLVGRQRLSRVAEGNAWLVVGGQVRNVRLIGYEGLRSIEPPAPGTVRLTGIVAAVEPGQVVELASARPRVGPLGPEPSVVRARVESSSAGEPAAWVNLTTARRLLGSKRLEVAVGPGDELNEQLAKDLEAALDGLVGVTVRDWQDLEPGLWIALRLEKVLVFVAVFLIVLVAVLALVADLYLLIADRRREVGILAALGATPVDLRRTFQRFGTALASIGALVGVVVGVGGAWLLDATGWVRLPGDGYLLEHVPFTVRAVDVLIIVASSLVLAWTVCRLATRTAVEGHPAEIIRR